MIINRIQVFQIAWPIILSNISTPLLGLVDTAVIGNLGDAALIGAIAVAGMIFSFLYWGFGFLRMGTTGLVAQAIGAGDEFEARASFYRAFLLGIFIGFVLVLFQWPLSSMALNIIDGSEAVEAGALTYFQIKIWAAPLSLSYLAILGYLLGCQDSRSILILQILLNGTNIVLDIIFVVWLEWGVAGVAAATVIAETTALIVGCLIIFYRFKKQGVSVRPDLGRLVAREPMVRMLAVNRDIMIRTLCLIFAFSWFTNQGAQAGDVVLAANAILMQFVSFAAFFLDGFALAAESLVGAATGARDETQLRQAVIFSTQLGLITAILLSSSFLLLGEPVVHLLTNVEAVREAADQYFVWVILAPVVSIWCYLLDGMFIGATKTPEMRNAMVISLIIYLLCWWLLRDWGNHGLWAALTIYFLARALSLGLYLPRVLRLA